MMGGNVGVADHVNIGRNVKVGAKAGVHGTVKDGKTIMGYPAIDAGDFKKLYLANAILVKHLKRLKKLLRGAGGEK
jgi:UDP-3-O-[3-hydroxymyristoyl] glucosamine N-acyltransferase